MGNTPNEWGVTQGRLIGKSGAYLECLANGYIMMINEIETRLEKRLD